MINYENLLKKAREGEMDAFNALFKEIQPKLHSYLYRLTTDIHDSDDMVQDVFIKAFENISGFKNNSSFKTWVFTIATNHARNVLKKQSRWHIDTQTRIKELAHNVPDLMDELEDTNNLSPHQVYEIKEHIDFCFTCVSKMLRLEEQLTLILHEIYNFKIKEIATILDFTESKVKHAMQDGKKNMIEIFDQNCALVSKTGICDQCSALNGKFNPKADAREKLIEIRMTRDASSESRQRLLEMRFDLCSSIDLLQTEGKQLHEVFFKLGRMVNKVS